MKHITFCLKLPTPISEPFTRVIKSNIMDDSFKELKIQKSIFVNMRGTGYYKASRLYQVDYHQKGGAQKAVQVAP